MTEKAKTHAANEAVYPIAEFVAASGRLFGCSPDVTAAALTLGGKAQYTKDEAKAIVKKFRERKVTD